MRRVNRRGGVELEKLEGYTDMRVRIGGWGWMLLHRRTGTRDSPGVSIQSCQVTTKGKQYSMSFTRVEWVTRGHRVAELMKAFFYIGAENA